MTNELHRSRRWEPYEQHDRAICGLVRLMAISLLALVGATWELWIPQTVFPQVPLVLAACYCPGWCDWACLVTLISASVTLLIVGRRGIASRVASVAIMISLSCFFILDQHRLQPWAWQFFLISILISLADNSTARRGWIWLTISIYFWSAVSKLDYNFFHDQGPTLIEGFKHAIGLRETVNRWTESFDVCAAVALAAGELSVAILLSIRRTRRFGVGLAVLMHVALLVALGPLGLNHSWGVLLWNLFFAGQTWLLFQSHSSEPREVTSLPKNQQVIPTCRWCNRVAVGFTLGAILWPILEPIEGCDHWLAWAVYSARGGQIEILVESDEPPTHGPVEYEQVLRTINGVSGIYYRPNVSRWSLKELGVPIYPQFRFQIAVGIDLMHRSQLENVHVVRWGRDRWNGKPTDVRIVDLSPGNSSSPSIWNTQPRWSNGE